MDNIEEQMNQEMYNAFMVNDDLFGYGQWDTTALSDKWKNAFETFAKQKKELGRYLEIALSDGNFSPDERDYVLGLYIVCNSHLQNLLRMKGKQKLIHIHIWHKTVCCQKILMIVL